MDKYTWDINYLANLKHQFKIKLFNTDDEEASLRYSSLSVIPDLHISSAILPRIFLHVMNIYY